MEKNFENYSNTDWANEFLANIKNELPDNESRAEFRGMLDANNIQENEAHDFLAAYKKGYEALKQFLERRTTAPEGEEHIKLPTEKIESAEPGPQKKAA